MGNFYKKIEKTFSAGEVIFSEDSDCDGMYIIDKGRVRVFKVLDTPSGSKELELVQLGPKSIFGEMALIDDKKRSASVQAMEETTCTIITKKMVEDQFRDLPGWVVNLIRILVARLRETNAKLRDKVKVYHDDTGGLVFVDESEGGRAKEMSQKLEGMVAQAEKKLKNISESIEDVRNKELKTINEIAEKTPGRKSHKASHSTRAKTAEKEEPPNALETISGTPDNAGSGEAIEEIEEKKIREITEHVTKLDHRAKKR